MNGTTFTPEPFDALCVWQSVPYFVFRFTTEEFGAFYKGASFEPDEESFISAVRRQGWTIRDTEGGRVALIPGVSFDLRSAIPTCVVYPAHSIITSSGRRWDAVNGWEPLSEPAPKEDFDWVAVAAHLNECVEAYESTPEGRLALMLSIYPARTRFLDGERTADLFDSIMDIKL